MRPYFPRFIEEIRKNDTEGFAGAALEVKNAILTSATGAIVTIRPEVVPGA